MAAAPRENTHTVVGNPELLERLDRDIRGGRLSHAYILDGKKGSGRHTIARHILAAIACSVIIVIVAVVILLPGKKKTKKNTKE